MRLVNENILEPATENTTSAGEILVDIVEVSRINDITKWNRTNHQLYVIIISCGNGQLYG